MDTDNDTERGAQFTTVNCKCCGKPSALRIESHIKKLRLADGTCIEAKPVYIDLRTQQILENIEHLDLPN